MVLICNVFLKIPVNIELLARSIVAQDDNGFIKMILELVKARRAFGNEPSELCDGIEMLIYKHLERVNKKN